MGAATRLTRRVLLSYAGVTIPMAAMGMPIAIYLPLLFIVSTVGTDGGSIQPLSADNPDTVLAVVQQLAATPMRERRSVACRACRLVLVARSRAAGPAVRLVRTTVFLHMRGSLRVG